MYGGDRQGCLSEVMGMGRAEGTLGGCYEEEQQQGTHQPTERPGNTEIAAGRESFDKEHGFPQRSSRVSESEFRLDLRVTLPVSVLPTKQSNASEDTALLDSKTFDSDPGPSEVARTWTESSSEDP